MVGRILGAAVAAVIAVTTANAAEAPRAPGQEWSFDGIFGTYDRNALRRGLTVYTSVCGACHSLDLVAYRHLGAVGYTEDEIKAIAAEFEVEDGPDEDGEMFSRAALPADAFAAPFPNEQAARAANSGTYPPDLSLITKARKHGADYLYAMLIEYRDEAPDGFELLDGMYYNEYFPGRQIAMPPPLFEDGVEYADGTKATVAQMAWDVTTFLAWAAEPEMEERKRLGIKVLIFVLVLTAMLYALKRQIWSRLH
jgi:cytochrome c1